jgi:hypothetical protein
MKHLMMIVCCMLACLGVVAQEGAPAGTAKKPEAAPAAKAEQLDPAAEAWIQMLAKRIADANQLVRESAVAALEKIGKPALPTLNGMTSSPDKAVADAAKKVVESINRGPQRAAAGAGRGPGQFGAERIAALAKEMGLDEQKTQKLNDLHKSMMDRARDGFEAVQAGDITREEFREEMTQHREEMKKELRKFLSEDEAKKIEDSFGRMGQGGGRRPGGEGGRRRRAGGGGGEDN